MFPKMFLPALVLTALAGCATGGHGHRDEMMNRADHDCAQMMERQHAMGDMKDGMKPGDMKPGDMKGARRGKGMQGCGMMDKPKAGDDHADHHPS